MLKKVRWIGLLCPVFSGNRYVSNHLFAMRAQVFATLKNSTPCRSDFPTSSRAFVQPVSFKKQPSFSGRMLQSQGSPPTF
jgi:hypothetical protein